MTQGTGKRRPGVWVSVVLRSTEKPRGLELTVTGFEPLSLDAVTDNGRELYAPTLRHRLLHRRHHGATRSSRTQQAAGLRRYPLSSR